MALLGLRFGGGLQGEIELDFREAPLHAMGFGALGIVEKVDPGDQLIAGGVGEVVVQVFVAIQVDLGSQMAICLLYTSPSPRDLSTSRMPSSA